MTVPIPYSWAEQTLYTPTGSPWDSQNTCVSPVAGLYTEGFSPDYAPSAENFNTILQQLFRACFDPNYGIQAITQVNSFAGLAYTVPGVGATSVNNAIAYVPGLGLYQWVAGSTAGNKGYMSIGTSGTTGTWFSAAYNLAGGGDGLSVLGAAALDATGKVPLSELPIATANGLATLDSGAHIVRSQLNGVALVFASQWAGSVLPSSGIVTSGSSQVVLDMDLSYHGAQIGDIVSVYFAVQHITTYPITYNVTVSGTNMYTSLSQYYVSDYAQEFISVSGTLTSNTHVILYATNGATGATSCLNPPTIQIFR